MTKTNEVLETEVKGLHAAISELKDTVNSRFHIKKIHRKLNKIHTRLKDDSKN